VEEQFPLCEEILITVCDQPLLTSDHIKKMINASQAEKTPIVASFYSGSPGVPVLFHQSMFKELLAMEDQHGAKKIIKDHIESVSLIDFPQGASIWILQTTGENSCNPSNVNNIFHLFTTIAHRINLKS